MLNWRAVYPLAVFQGPVVLEKRAKYPLAVLVTIFPPPRPTVILLIVASPPTTSSLVVGELVPIPTLPAMIAHPVGLVAPPYPTVSHPLLPRSHQPSQSDLAP